MPDKYQATWVSYSSISDFQKCPRLYYLNNVYKDPTTGNKITLMKPPLALGQVVHETLESLLELPKEKRMKQDLLASFEQNWQDVAGKKGGFTSDKQEQKFKQRGKDMISKIKDNPGPLANLAVKIEDDLPYFWLDEAEEIILCGKVDWLEYLEEQEAVHIIDFKTGKNREETDSLQLPIYYLLADKCQSWDIAKASYWYLADDNTLVEKTLPNREEAYKKILSVAKEIKRAKAAEDFACNNTDGCYHCRPYEKIKNGEAELVDVDKEYNSDIYILPN